MVRSQWRATGTRLWPSAHSSSCLAGTLGTCAKVANVLFTNCAVLCPTPGARYGNGMFLDDLAVLDTCTCPCGLTCRRVMPLCLTSRCLLPRSPPRVEYDTTAVPAAQCTRVALVCAAGRAARCVRWQRRRSTVQRRVGVRSLYVAVFPASRGAACHRTHACHAALSPCVPWVTPTTNAAHYFHHHLHLHHRHRHRSHGPVAVTRGGRHAADAAVHAQRRGARVTHVRVRRRHGLR